MTLLGGTQINCKLQKEGTGKGSSRRDWQGHSHRGSNGAMNKQYSQGVLAKNLEWALKLELELFLIHTSVLAQDLCLTTPLCNDLLA